MSMCLREGSYKNCNRFKKVCKRFRVKRGENLLTIRPYSKMDYYSLTNLIRKYRSGTATPQELYLLENWWHQAQRDTSALDNLPPEERQLLKDHMFAETQRLITLLAKPATRWYHSVIYRSAAAVTFVAVVGALLYWSSHRMNTLHALPGEHLCITLPDSTHITLNGNTTLRYPANWDAHSTREVWIDGEAFFEVQHTASHQKFIVHTSHDLDVEVLGTKFNLRSREQTAEVMLAEGKVKLAMANSVTAPVYLNPGEVATVAGAIVSKRAAEQKTYTSWINNKLIFNRTPLRDIALRLHDTYGLNITFADTTLAQRELSGEIASATAGDILYAIAETFSLTVTRNDTEVTIDIPKTN